MRWGTELHDRFLLPHFVWQDFEDVLEDMREHDYPLSPEWFAPHFEFRFPQIGAIARRGVVRLTRHLPSNQVGRIMPVVRGGAESRQRWSDLKLRSSQRFLQLLDPDTLCQLSRNVRDELGRSGPHSFDRKPRHQIKRQAEAGQFLHMLLGRVQKLRRPQVQNDPCKGWQQSFARQSLANDPPWLDLPVRMGVSRQLIQQ